MIIEKPIWKPFTCGMCKIDGEVCTVSYLPKHKLKCIDFVPTYVVKNWPEKARVIYQGRDWQIYTQEHTKTEKKKEREHQRF